MSAAKPYFTIVIPTYNRAALIGKTLKSILDQSFTDYEVIVVDDGSKDHTEEVVQSLGYSKLFYYKKVNGERGAARNYGIERASGRYITFIDSDDVLYPQHFETAYQFLEEHPGINCYAQAYEIKDTRTGKVLVKPYLSTAELINNKIIKGNFLSCFGVFIAAEALKEVRFEEDRKFAGTEDWLLWLQMAARYPFYYNNKVTGAMLEHNSRSVLSFNEESLMYRTEFLKRALQRDFKFLQRFGSESVDKIYAHMLSYSSLHLAMSKKKGAAIQYWLKAGRVDLGELLTRRSLAIIKKVIFT